jgi:regulator of replication initiation timing
MTYEEMTTQHDRNTAALEGDTNAEYNLEELVAELAAVREENRKLQDQLKKTVKAASNAERASAEALRAHTKMVETLTETMRENTALTIERDMWQGPPNRCRSMIYVLHWRWRILPSPRFALSAKRLRACTTPTPVAMPNA